MAKALKKAPTTVPALVAAYAEGDEPWCLLDTHHRHMESRKYDFEFAAGGEHDSLEKLIVKAEQRYTEVGSDLAKPFVTQFPKAKHPIQGPPAAAGGLRDAGQAAARRGQGRLRLGRCPAVRDGPGAGRRAPGRLRADAPPALGTPPTITEIGMAALLPKADESARVVAGRRRQARRWRSPARSIKDRKDRIAFLKDHAGVPIVRRQARRPAAQAVQEGQGRHRGRPSWS